MVELAVIIPSRGRPDNVARLLTRFVHNGAASAVVCVDDDDPCAQRYAEVVKGCSLTKAQLVRANPMRLVPWLNAIAPPLAERWPYIGFMGDDHLPQTWLWAETICRVLAEMGTGIVYGDDRLQGERLPTAVFMTSDIIRTLGYMVPPELVHMYADNAWMEWGAAMGRLRYLPDVVIEHLHPGNGKAPMDAGYQTSAQFMGPDGEAFGRYMAQQFPADAEKLRALL